jgi:DNA-binding MarR family transcriptional regulator
MSHRTLAEEAEIRTWVRFIAAHTAITHALEAQLLGAHGLTLSDYDVLVQLSRAEDRRMRNIELANTVGLTRSGVTRLVDGLEGDGLVTRVSCPSDKRGTLIMLTDEGMRVLREAADTHLVGVRELFLEKIGKEGRQALDKTLGKLPGGADCDLEHRACLANTAAGKTKAAAQ